MESGDLAGCEQWLRQALAAAPHDGNLLTNLAVVRRQRGDAREAMELLERAAGGTPPHGPAAVQLALTLKQQGRDNEAVARLEPMIASGGAPAGVLALQAQLLERLSRLEEARAHAEGALALDPAEPVALLLLAELDLRASRPADALERIGRLPPAATESPVNGALAQYLASRAHDQLGRPDAAYASAEKANRILAQDYFRRHRGDEGPYAPPAVQIVRRWLRALPATRTPSMDAPCKPPPVFLLGFPRSGTTLLEQVLRRHPGIAAIEEKELLAPLIAPYLARPEELAVLADPAGTPWRDVRRRYVQDARAAARADQGQIVVDKLPLNSVFLPVIGQLFPEARVLLALRDPRDVCLSCFLQSFALNAAMAQFLDLGTTAAYYEAVMDNALATMERLPMQILTVRYEAVVDNLAAEARRMLAFLGLPWDPGVLAYHDGLENRLVNTPSRSQVSRPVYRTSLGRWRRYAAHLSPVLPQLDALATRLGYPTGWQDGSRAGR
jgi:tetratricopeptide (TPR) repeat protein